jgi:hypothetical protein
MAVATNPSPDPTTDKPPRARRWIPLGVRLFVAILAILGLTAVWIAVPAYRQYVAIREIERCGGDIGGLLRIRREIGPTWLREFVGEDLMMAVEEVDDIYFNADSATVNRRMKKLYYDNLSIITLDRDGPSIDDFSLSCNTGIPRLKRLSLRFWKSATLACNTSFACGTLKTWTFSTPT